MLAAAVADDLLVQLRDHGLPGPFLLVGHSLGGLYVQAFARNHPDEVAGMVLVDASSPLEPPGVFVSRVPPKPGTIEAAEEAGVAPSVAALLAGPPLPPVPLVVLAATVTRPRARRFGAMCGSDLPHPHRRAGSSLSTEATSSKKTGPEDVIAAVLSVAADTGADIKACRS